MIFYFTGTGNSLYCAKKIGEGINESLVNIAEATANKQFTYKISAKEKIGFIFPVYYYGIPNIVANFIDKIQLTENEKPYIFSVITCGGSIAGADKMFSGMMKKRNYSVNIFFELKMIDNYVLLYDLATESSQKLKLSNADRKINEFINTINYNINNGYESGKKSTLLTAFAYPLYKHGRKTKKFYADDQCISCGKCKDICPVKAIDIVNKKPVWIKDRCVHCLACIHRCPEKAIQYGKATRKRRRFINPVL